MSSSDVRKWCVVGDYNCVRRAYEREGMGDGDYGRREREEFNAFIEHMALEDVLVVGRKFTWYRPSETTISRISRHLYL